MDLGTIILMLAVGSFLFGLLLVVFKYKKSNPQEVPFWIMAKFLQAAGSLILYHRTGSYDALTMVANALLLSGCAYETWTIRVLCGKTVKRRLHVSVTMALVVACLATLYIAAPFRAALICFLQSVFYILPGVFLFYRSEFRTFLRKLLGICYFVTGSAFLLCTFACLIFNEDVAGLREIPLFAIIPTISFCQFLISGYIMLMLAKERSDMQIMEIQKALEKTETKFQRIVETAIEGILIFDKQFRITFANNNMATILGYTIEEMIGRSYISFFPVSHLDVYYQQEALRKKGAGSVYECCLLRKDGKIHWFLISAKPIFDEQGNFDGSFAMLTDINERKEMELLLEESNRRLTELSNQDSLTGIANRRCFDATLEREYSRLKRSHSKLSIILIDIDYFKDYNDFYGHVMGDECLRLIGRALSRCINRSVDLAARYGGEEFACILPDTDINTAVKIAENIRQQIHDLKIEHKKSLVSKYVTASFGVTTVEYSPETALEEIVATADRLLYKAKVSGRNRIEFAEFSDLMKKSFPQF